MRNQVTRLLEKMVPDPHSCREAAMTLRAEHPEETSEQLARRAINAARKAGVATGAATGVFSSPLTMVPAAVADMTAMLRIEGVMAGVIAALMEPESLDDGSLRADVVSILFPGAISQVARQFGIRAGEQLGRTIVRKYLTEDLLKLAVRMGAKQIGAELTRKVIVEKTVPLVGAGIGAGWNWLEVSAVGERAIRYYKGEPLQLPGQTTVGRAAGRVKDAFRRLTGRDRPGGPLPALPAPADATASAPVPPADAATTADVTSARKGASA